MVLTGKGTISTHESFILPTEGAGLLSKLTARSCKQQGLLPFCPSKSGALSPDSAPIYWRFSRIRVFRHVVRKTIPFDKFRQEKRLRRPAKVLHLEGRLHYSPSN